MLMGNADANKSEGSTSLREVEARKDGSCIDVVGSPANFRCYVSVAIDQSVNFKIVHCDPRF